MGRIGSQEPRIRVVPEGAVYTDGDDAVELYEAYGYKLDPWQRNLVRDWLLRDGNGRLLISTASLSVPRQNGKAVDVNTKVPTVDGWKTIAELKVGDMVFDEEGKPTKVIYKSPLFVGHECFEVEFEDGDIVVADGDHLWNVCSDGTWKTLTTKELSERTIERVRTYRGREKKEHPYSVPLGKPLEYPERVLPIDPYLLGYWLGDGTSTVPELTVSHDDCDEAVNLLEGHGFSIRVCKHKEHADKIKVGAVHGRTNDFMDALRSLDLVGNKHIPDVYLQSSVSQRVELLRGLMDTDGFCSSAGQCEFVQKPNGIIAGFSELLNSLGIKHKVKDCEKKCLGKACAAQRITFFVDKEHTCFHFKRKTERLKERLSRKCEKKIVAVRHCDSVPTQCISVDSPSRLWRVGKAMNVTHNTLGAEVLEFYLLCAVPDFRILHTAHQVKTSKKAFRRLCRLFEDKKHPEVGEMVASIRRTNGEEAIYLKNGSSIEYVARSKNSARGFDGISLIIYDEAQELNDDQLEALLATMTASPTGDRLSVYMGTPPGPTTAGTVFKRVRKAALENPGPHVSHHEWSVETCPAEGTPFSELIDQIYETNPAMGIRADLEHTENAEFNTMSIEGFARERLGWYQEGEVVDPAIDPAAWDALGIDNPSRSKRARVAVGVKFSPDGQRVAWAVAQQARGRKPHVELVEYRDISHTGTGLVGSWIIERKKRLAFVEIDGQANAGALVKRLEDAKYPEKGYKRCSVGDVVDAASMLMDGIRDKSFTHFKQAPLTESALGVTKRPIGSHGGFGFDGTEPEPIEAAMLALHALKTTKRNPGRRCRVL